MHLRFLSFLLPLVFACSEQLEGAFVFQNGKLKNAEEVAVMPVEAHFAIGVEAMDCCNWREASKNFKVVSCNFPGSVHYSESLFFLGVSYYYLGEYDFANDAFSDYLKSQGHPKHFEEALGFKLAIAEAFREGARRHLLETKHLPKWASGHSLAITIYDEVICALPCHEYAALSLYSKAYMLWMNRDWRETVEAYQMLIRRFPKHELAPVAYLCINRVYLEQSLSEFQNPDILALAQINYRKFAKDFPKDERLEDAEADIQAIKEVYARGLYETGQFYERVCHPNASVIYYMSAVKQFPDTQIAELCRGRLEILNPCPIEEVSEIEVSCAS